MDFFGVVWIGLIFFRQPGQCFVRQIVPVFQITRYNQLFVRMPRKPPFAMAHQFLQFIFTHPIMLLRIQNGY
jgi:hypothetical protein